MYYFRHLNTNHLFIDLNGKDFEPELEQKIRVQFTTKDIITVFIHDDEGNLYPVKKSGTLRRTIFDLLSSSVWDRFIVDGEAIEGIANEDGEIVSPSVALFPHITPKEKPRPYAFLANTLADNRLPLFNEEHVIKKQTAGEYTHIYYRINHLLYHICFNSFEKTITAYEIFSKIS